MSGILDVLIPDGDPTLVVSVMVFLAAATLAFGAMAALRVRSSVRRRANEIAIQASGPTAGSSSLRHARKAADKLIEYTTKHHSPTGGDATRELRRRLVQAGFLDPRAAAFFFLARIGLALALAVAAVFAAPLLISDSTGLFWLVVWLTGIGGYFLPNFYLDRRIKSRQLEHRAGFPDFMDLLVVCAEAGLSMEASLDRVGRELADSYPSLSANIYMAILEIRAGRAVSEALEHFGDRLGIEEARSFATLLQQSEEFGSSVTDALRVYSDDMRHKRLSRAEERAHALPAKLSVPLMVCVFPVVIIVIMLPVYVRFKYGSY